MTKSPAIRAAFAACELGGIGVPLLGHHARPGRVALVEFGPAERRVGPSREVGGQPRQVRRDGSTRPPGTPGAKSRSLTASIEFSNARRTRAARPWPPGSSPSVEVASAPAPSGETDARTRPVGERSRSRDSAHACASRWCPSVTGCAGRAWVVPGIGSRRARARARPAPASARGRRPSIDAGDREQLQAEVGRRPDRCGDRPACSFAPTSPSRSVTPRSIAEWMSSSCGVEHERTAPRSRRRPRASAGVERLRFLGGQQPGVAQRAPRARSPACDVLRAPAARRTRATGRAPAPPAPVASRTGPAHSGPASSLTRPAAASPTTP